MAEMDVREVQFSLAIGVQPQADAFVGKGLANVIVPPLVREVAAG